METSAEFVDARAFKLSYASRMFVTTLADVFSVGLMGFFSRRVERQMRAACRGVGS